MSAHFDWFVTLRESPIVLVLIVMLTSLFYLRGSRRRADP